MTAAAGTGPGVITPDGCAVDVYLRMPPWGEAELVHDAVPAGASVLDLGAGVGRITHPLVALGHPVVAVDFSAAMLAHVRDAETVCAPIAGLELGRRFDVVLMASHLLHNRDAADLLATAVRHVAWSGVVIAQLYPARWFDTVRDGDGGAIGPVQVRLSGVMRTGDEVAATVHYRLDDREWTQTFTARRRDDEALHRELRDAGLSVERWLDDDRTWLVARAIA